MTDKLDPKEEYEIHRQKTWDTDGIGLPTWEELTDSDRAEWEHWINPKERETSES